MTTSAFELTRVFFIMLAAVDQTASTFRCYHCEDCATVTEYTPTFDGCSSCEKNDSYHHVMKMHVVYRYCRLNHCQSVTRDLGHLKSEVNCCYTELCNMAPLICGSVKLVILLVSTTILVTYFA
ncbi:hypothetical protein FGIG_03656 [Fasciola gigantica]|uniref:CD59 glycoprotein-like n=1 Tax=Fasciola gigantica TaxID=46835 RepID=A0A504YBK3_FASGI|nr:hypothetical protein FGIG_03656 [Fasciola gigantica]